MANPKVSILMAAYNRPQFIDRAAKSIVSQTFTDWELLVVDDSTNDDVYRKVSEWTARDPRVRCVRTGHLGRIAKVSNLGLANMKGDYVAILDDDDYWLLTTKLEEQVAFLDANRDYVACGGGYSVVNARGEETRRFLKPERHPDIVKNALVANPMANSTTMFQRDVASRLGNYDETMLQFADWDFWLKLGCAGKLYNAPKYYAAYQMWSEGMSFAKQREAAWSARLIVRRYKHSYPGYSKAFLAAWAYTFYAYMPALLKRALNPVFSNLKKFLFARPTNA